MRSAQGLKLAAANRDDAEMMKRGRIAGMTGKNLPAEALSLLQLVGREELAHPGVCNSGIGTDHAAIVSAGEHRPTPSIAVEIPRANQKEHVDGGEESTGV